MTVLTSPIVGSHFHPPAKLVLQYLPAGCQLVLQPEPENPYDAKAIRVLVSPGQIPAKGQETLRDELPDSGFTIEGLLADGTGHGLPEAPLIWLGFLPDSDGAVCRKLKCAGNREVGELIEAGFPMTTHLWFNPDGSPAVRVTVDG